MYANSNITIRHKSFAEQSIMQVILCKRKFSQICPF